MVRRRSPSGMRVRVQQWPASMRCGNLWSSAVSAISASVLTVGSTVSSAWKSSSQPWSAARRNRRSSASAAEPGRGRSRRRGTPRRPRPWRSRRPAYGPSSSDRGRRRTGARPAGRCGRAIRRGARRRPARRCGSATRCNRDGCGSRACRRRRRPCSAKLMRARTSAAVQWASRSSGTAVRAPITEPSGFGGPRPDMALVEMGVRIDEAGHHQAGALQHRQGGIGRPGSGRREGRDAAVLDQEIGPHEALGIGGGTGPALRQAGRHPGIGDAPPPGGGREAERARHLSRPPGARCRASDAGARS